MRRALLILAAVAAVVAVEAVRRAPASLADAEIARMTGGLLRVADAEGTLWHARGSVVAGATRIPVAWRIDAWPLVRGELRIHLMPRAEADGGTPRADIGIVGERVALHDVDFTLPASLLSAFPGSGRAWTLGGDVRVTVAALEWAPPSSRGSARAVWREARLAGASSAASLNLGEVSVALVADGDRLGGPVANVGGDLAVSGDVTLRVADGLRLSLLLAPRRADDTALASALAAIGTAEGAGWRVVWRVPFQ